MFVAESEMSGTRTVRQADAAVCLPELSGFAIQLINIGHIKAKVTDQDFIPCTAARFTCRYTGGSRRENGARHLNSGHRGRPFRCRNQRPEEIHRVHRH